MIWVKGVKHIKNRSQPQNSSRSLVLNGRLRRILRTSLRQLRGLPADAKRSLGIQDQKMEREVHMAEPKRPFSPPG